MLYFSLSEQGWTCLPKSCFVLIKVDLFGLSYQKSICLPKSEVVGPKEKLSNKGGLV